MAAAKYFGVPKPVNRPSVNKVFFFISSDTSALLKSLSNISSLMKNHGYFPKHLHD